MGTLIKVLVVLLLLTVFRVSAEELDTVVVGDGSPWVVNQGTDTSNINDWQDTSTYPSYYDTESNCGEDFSKLVNQE